MKLVLPALGLAVTGLLTTGCLQQRELMDPEANLGIEAGGPVANIALSDGLLAGDFGSRRGFDGDATEMNGSTDYEFKTTNVVVTREENSRGAGMVILWTNGRTLEQLEVGRHDFEYDPQALEQDTVTANVCSGDSAASIDYDQPADRGTLLVEDDPEGGRRITVETETARLDPTTGDRDFNRMETSSTSFTFVPGGQQ
jgi:hypothetical protein